MSISCPSPEALRSFGVSEVPRLLDGGQGETFRAGGVILKPAGSSGEVAWASDLFASTKIDGIRTARPIRAINGSWVVDGFACQSLLTGSHRWDRWYDVLEVSKKFHQGLSGVARPDWIDDIDDVYRRADRFAWSEGDIQRVNPDVSILVQRLLGARSPILVSSQLIHGDIAGNILFDDGEDPAVIDFSPYWRPADYADAIVVVDAVSWHGGTADLIDEMLVRPNGAQHLIRAGLFRFGVDAQTEIMEPGVLDGHTRFAEALFGRLQTHQIGSEPQV